MSDRNRGVLKAVAQGMRAQLAGKKRGWDLRLLHRGLHVSLQRQERQWRLAMARVDVYPGELEVQICAEAFNVPAGTEPVKLEHQPAGKYINFRVVELRWLEDSDEPGESADCGAGRAGGGVDCDGGGGGVSVDQPVAAPGGRGRSVAAALRKLI